MELPKVGDVVEKLLPVKDEDRFFFVLENPYERFYKMVNIATSQKENWNLGWTEEAEKHWKYEWRII